MEIFFKVKIDLDQSVKLKKDSKKIVSELKSKYTLTKKKWTQGVINNFIQNIISPVPQKEKSNDANTIIKKEKNYKPKSNTFYTFNPHYLFKQQMIKENVADSKKEKTRLPRVRRLEFRPFDSLIENKDKIYQKNQLKEKSQIK